MKFYISTKFQKIIIFIFTIVAEIIIPYFLIFKFALLEGFIKSYKEIFVLFIAGFTTFTFFELFGPQVIAITVLSTPFYYFAMNRIEKNASLL